MPALTHINFDTRVGVLNHEKLMKNPVSVLGRSFGVWRAMRQYPGVFSLADASKWLRHVVQPNRITVWELRRWIDKSLVIREETEGVYEILVRGTGLMFYWLGSICDGLANGVLQEVDRTHPHHYTTPPIEVGPSSLVLDVGSCEGLFAFRLLKREQAARVVCFEPSNRSAFFLRRGAEKNRVAENLEIEICAVGRESGEVSFVDSDAPEANRVMPEGGPGTTRVPQISLDDYCRERNIELGPTDLIKVDAEGADVEVIRGAERLIREGSPQIAVTTYHRPEHAMELIEFLRSFQPRYQLRLKGFALFNTKTVPRPVLLQAALPRTDTKS